MAIVRHVENTTTAANGVRFTTLTGYDQLDAIVFVRQFQSDPSVDLALRIADIIAEEQAAAEEREYQQIVGSE